jgi:tetratricopeptide (TPR) repeat protein
MTLSYTAKQRLIYLAIVFAVVISTHYLYQWLNPQWIAYRRAEVSYQNQDWDSAILYYRESLEKGANNPYIYSKLGDVYSKTRDFPMAVKAYEKYLELKPHDLWAMRAYAGVLTANGEFDRAAQEYEKILKEEAKQSQP